MNDAAAHIDSGRQRVRRSNSGCLAQGTVIPVTAYGHGQKTMTHDHKHSNRYQAKKKSGHEQIFQRRLPRLPSQGTHVDKDNYQVTDDICSAPELRPPQRLENGACDDEIAHSAYTCREGYKLIA